MRTLKTLLRPSWTKVVLALILFGLYFSSFVQAYAFQQLGPKPRLYDLLSPLGLWPASVLLFLPIHAAAGTIRGPWPEGSARLWFFVLAGLYSVVLAWVFVFAHQRGGVRLYRPGRLAIPLIPVAILFVLAHTWPESTALSGASLAISGVLFTGLVAAFFIYLVFCLTRGIGRSAWWSARTSRPGA